MSFHPDEVSTVRTWIFGDDGAHYPDRHPFDYEYIRCPPPGVSWGYSQGTYRPVIDALELINTIDPAFESCIAASGQGIGPISILQPTNAPEKLVRLGGGFRAPRQFDRFPLNRRNADIFEPPIITARNPQMTSEATEISSRQHSKATEQARAVPLGPQGTSSPTMKL